MIPEDLKMREGRPEIAIRKAKPQDLDAIAEIENESFSNPWSRDSLERNIAGANRAYCFVALSENAQIVGYVAMWLVLDDAQITNLAVKSTWRRKGIGQALLNYITRDAKKRGALLLSLEVSDRNDPAIRLYEKNHFVKEGFRRNYYGNNGGNAIIMLRKIET
jgi:[ribosomal protein S18]-alanine N-acetyltransferase